MHQNKKNFFFGTISLFCVLILLFGLLGGLESMAMEIKIPLPIAKAQRIMFLSQQIARLSRQRNRMKLQSRRLDDEIAATRLQIQQCCQSQPCVASQEPCALSQENHQLPVLHKEKHHPSALERKAHEASLAYYQRLLARKRDLQIALLKQAYQIQQLQRAVSQLRSLPCTSLI